MIDFQSIQTTTAPTCTALARPATVAFVERDSMASSHVLRGWTLPANGKSPQKTRNKTAEGDSNTLDDFRVQGTQSEVTSAISA